MLHHTACARSGVSSISYPCLTGPGKAMATAKKLTTTVSTKGQIILPKAIRQQRRWRPGTQLVVEDTEEGVLLKAAPLMLCAYCNSAHGFVRIPMKLLTWKLPSAARVNATGCCIQASVTMMK